MTAFLIGAGLALALPPLVVMYGRRARSSTVALGLKQGGRRV
jgi:hypothetical protein